MTSNKLQIKYQEGIVQNTDAEYCTKNYITETFSADPNRICGFFIFFYSFTLTLNTFSLWAHFWCIWHTRKLMKVGAHIKTWALRDYTLILVKDRACPEPDYAMTYPSVPRSPRGISSWNYPEKEHYEAHTCIPATLLVFPVGEGHLGRHFLFAKCPNIREG